MRTSPLAIRQPRAARLSPLVAAVAFALAPAAYAAPAVGFSPTTLNFGSVEVNTTSPALSAIVRSLGDQPYVIGAFDSNSSCFGGPICYGGAFICSTTCTTGSEYATGASCRVTASFAPIFSGTQAATIYFCDNTSASPNFITLVGNAVLPPPIRISPTSWDFGDVEVGGTSAPHEFVVSNTTYGGIPVAFATSGEFDIVANSCGSSVPGRGNCTVEVAFGPTQSGAARGELLVTATTGCGVECLVSPTAIAVDLFGNGVEGGQLALPEAIDVGAAIFGGSPISKTVELRNTGTAPVTFSTVSVSSLFTLVNNCPVTLAPGEACTLLITFTAPGLGEFSGTLLVVSDAAGATAEIPVTARGQVSPLALLRATPEAIGFGSRVIGSQSTAQTVTITNLGAAETTVSLTASAIDFVIAGNGCTGSLAPQATCFAQVAFRPLGFGQRTGSLIVAGGAGQGDSVALSGTGCRPYIASGNRSGSSSYCAP